MVRLGSVTPSRAMRYNLTHAYPDRLSHLLPHRRGFRGVASSRTLLFIAAFAGLGPLAHAADPTASNTRPTISSRSTLTFATLPQAVPGTLAYIGDGLAANCGMLRDVADEMAGGIRERGSRSGLL